MRAVWAVVRRPWRAALFLLYYVWELAVANGVLAWEIATPRYFMRPGIVRVPIEAETDFEVTALANLISFTPGTLTIEVAEDRSAIFVHALYVDTPEGLRRQVGRLERRLLWAVR